MADPRLDLAVARAVAALPPAMQMVGLTAEDLDEFRTAVVSGALEVGAAQRAAGQVRFEEIIVPAEGRPDGVPLLVVRPLAVPPSGLGIYYVHGGGLIAGDNRTGLDRLVEWSATSGVTLVSVDYRLAPEHTYADMVNDCYAGLEWMAKSSSDLAFDPTRLVIAGASAGGGLAAATALLARDRNGPAISHQVLYCPMLDHRLETASSSYSGLPWDRTSNDFGWAAALGNRLEPDAEAAALLPMLVEDLSGLPPTYLDVGTAESFRDEVLEFARRLLAAEVPTEVHVWFGGTHGFDRYAEGADVTRAARIAQASFLDRILRGDIG